MIRIYSSNHRSPCRTERCEQIDAMGWLEKNHPERFALVIHVPNETKGTMLHMQTRKKEGVKSGAPDIIDLNGPVTGLFEMKRLDSSKSRLSKEQRDFLKAAADRGHFCAVCYGFEQFRLAYADFLNLIGEGG